MQWLVYRIPPDQGCLPEGYKHKADPKDPVDAARPQFARQRRLRRPLGTLGRTIRYRFRLLALDQPLELPPGLDKEAFLEAVSGHVLEQSDLITTYERRP